MSRLFALVLVLISCHCLSQNGSPAWQQSGNTKSYASFVTTVDFSKVTKDGIYMEDYVVAIPYNKAKELDGKKVRISGEVTICSGLENLPKEYNKDGNEIIVQGREKDSRHILKPKIEIIN